MRRVGRRIVFENDANCFALAEAQLGAGRPYVEGVIFGVIMGSGVGGGVVLRGKTWGGPQSLAGEWGHHAVGPWGVAERASRRGEPWRRVPLVIAAKPDVSSST